MSKRRLPETASIAHQGDGEQMFAPSAARNMQALCDLLQQVAPSSGAALELASGTGQHVIGFARALPDFDWQPTEPDATRRASIDAYAAQSDVTNIAPARPLDVSEAGWGAQNAGTALIVVVNLLHLISRPEVLILIREAAEALAPRGRFVIYGPFMRAGELTSDGDISFHASLTTQDPEIGYKDDFDVLEMAQAVGLDVVEVIEMPANNLALILGKPGL